MRWHLPIWVCTAMGFVLITSAIAGSAQGQTSTNYFGYNSGDRLARAYGDRNDTGSHGSGGLLGESVINITSSGVQRTFKLYVPQNVSIAKDPVPLLIFIHGANDDYNRGIWLWKNYADRDCFIIADPQMRTAGPYTWDELEYFKQGYQTYMDTAFIMNVINETTALYNIDLSRVWLDGMSDGGSMSFRFGVLLSDRFSVVCPHSCLWKPDLASPGWACRKIPVYARVGENDTKNKTYWIVRAQENFTAAGFEFKLDIVPGLGHEWDYVHSCDYFLSFEKNRTLPHNWLRPFLSFNSPAPGDKWNAGTSHSVGWWLGCGNESYDVTLEYSTSGQSGPWNGIDMTSQQNYGLGQFQWEIPPGAPSTKNAVLRAIVTDSSSPVQKTTICVMNYSFEITGQPVPETGSLVFSLAGGLAIMAVFIYVWKIDPRRRDR